jgi:aryl-alcohol dehydrogenase-like predicted oxidoreductase
LHPYRDDLVIATKGGFVRDRNGAWITDGRPSHLREALEGSLRRLRLEAIDLYQLHRVDAAVPLEDQVGTLAELRGEGKIRHIGLSEVSVGQLTRAEAVTPIATVQNLFNLADRKSADVLAYAAGRSIGFIPWFPLATGGLARSPRLSQIAARQGISASQVALAWLLQHSDNMLPIPGTAQVPHLEDNVAAAGIRLDAEELAALDRLA